ncbi:MAG: peptidylprolyl isomerase, partial [Tidjanibacter sp.]|nr:peptidylprolyl isomerase [Tidjanibacter sp.]
VRHILRKPQYSTDNIKKMLLRLDSIASDIKDEKFTFEEGAEVISHDKETRNNYGMMYNKMTASSHFKMDELPVDVARVVDGLKVGEISQPFTWLQDNSLPSASGATISIQGLPMARLSIAWALFCNWAHSSIF